MRLARQYLGSLVKHSGHAFLLCFQPLAGVDGLRSGGAGFLSPELYFFSVWAEEGQGQRTVVVAPLLSSSFMLGSCQRREVSQLLEYSEFSLSLNFHSEPKKARRTDDANPLKGGETRGLKKRLHETNIERSPAKKSVKFLVISP